MADPSGPQMIEAIAGPYAGQRLQMEPADAAKAIADGWAVDPFAPPPTEEELAKRKEPTEEDRLKSTEAADKAARKLRGEDEPENDKGQAEAAAIAKPAPAEATGTIAGAGTSTTKAKR